MKNSERKASFNHSFFQFKHLFSAIILNHFINKGKLVELLKDLVKINSVNPSLVTGAAGEAEIAEYIKDWMEAYGLETEFTIVEAGRANVVGFLKGSGGGKTLMFNGHIDTVGTDYMTIDPFDPKVVDAFIRVRKSADLVDAGSLKI